LSFFFLPHGIHFPPLFCFSLNARFGSSSPKSLSRGGMSNFSKSFLHRGNSGPWVPFPAGGLELKPLPPAVNSKDWPQAEARKTNENGLPSLFFFPLPPLLVTSNPERKGLDPPYSQLAGLVNSFMQALRTSPSPPFARRSSTRFFSGPPPFYHSSPLPLLPETMLHALLFQQ